MRQRTEKLQISKGSCLVFLIFAVIKLCLSPQGAIFPSMTFPILLAVAWIKGVGGKLQEKKVGYKGCALNDDTLSHVTSINLIKLLC